MDYFQRLENTAWIQMPCTFGDTYISNAGVEVPLETVLTADFEQRTRLLLDYILQFEPLVETNEHAEASKLRIKEGSTEIQKFMAKPGRPYTQLSDHYGVSITLELDLETQVEEQPRLNQSIDSNQSNPQTAAMKGEFASPIR